MLMNNEPVGNANSAVGYMRRKEPYMPLLLAHVSTALN
jgi:hypothetical protein